MDTRARSASGPRRSRTRTWPRSWRRCAPSGMAPVPPCGARVAVQDSEACELALTVSYGALCLPPAESWMRSGMVRMLGWLVEGRRCKPRRHCIHFGVFSPRLCAARLLRGLEELLRLCGSAGAPTGFARPVLPPPLHPCETRGRRGMAVFVETRFVFKKASVKFSATYALGVRGSLPDGTSKRPDSMGVPTTHTLGAGPT